jgi:TPR repeat protein
MQRAAEMGYAPAQAECADMADAASEERLFWARKAAAQGDRRGMYHLSQLTYSGLGGCVKDLDAACFEKQLIWDSGGPRRA